MTEEKNDPLNKDVIESKIKLYEEIFITSHKECKEKKEGLDLYYNHLHKVNSVFQTSIIFLSAGSTFMQSLTSDDENDKTIIKIIVLSITSYSGFILALGKFLKLEDMRESVHNLRDRFADLQNKINYFIDLMKPWKNSHYYHNISKKEKDKATEWVSLIERIESEYVNIIDTKRELSSSYDKIIDSVITKKYKLIYDKINSTFKQSICGCKKQTDEDEDKDKEKDKDKDKDDIESILSKKINPKEPVKKPIKNKP